ncbi:hypothetical protein PVL29_012329 [Vitis rotundifolia]|uniref:Protein kinase domain-containing protein n=1 Tax=Vitis rotundifolia TaxID=103349 RepID=A0AA38ZR90_VITRO|nr:hypothetical protein PVL29_012329 [Vitis rotundifolia]
MERCRGKLSEFEVRRYARMIVRALCHMHERGVIHCNLKPDNVTDFPDGDGGNVVKIADHEVARRIGEQEVHRVQCRGTPAHMSLESLALHEHEAPMDISFLGAQ